MSDFKYKKKGGYRSKATKKTKVDKIEKQVKQLVKNSKTTEGFLNIASSSLPVQSTGTQSYSIGMLAQGLNEGERRGTEVQPLSLKGKIIPRTDTSNVGNQVGRVIFVKSKDSNAGNIPAVSDLLTDITIPWSNYKQDYTKTLQVLFDRTFMINRTSFDTTAISEQWCRPINFNIKFPASTSSQTYLGATATSFDSNGIFMFVLGTQSSGAQPASIDINANFKYQS